MAIKFEVVLGFTKFEIKRVKDWRMIANQAMKENRKLTTRELLRVISEAPQEELKRILEAMNEVMNENVEFLKCQKQDTPQIKENNN